MRETYDEATQQCTACGHAFLESEFIKKRMECKKCVARALSRKCMRKKYARDKLRESVMARSGRAKEVAKALLARSRLRVAKKRFGALVGPHKYRLGVLSKQLQTTKTMQAIEARKLIIAKYEAAYAKQIELIRQGVLPDDITKYL